MKKVETPQADALEVGGVMPDVKEQYKDRRVQKTYHQLMVKRVGRWILWDMADQPLKKGQRTSVRVQ